MDRLEPTAARGSTRFATSTGSPRTGRFADVEHCGPREAMTETLTPSQREAVEHDQGPLLVLAGPGSGKTRVITYRIARLLQRGVDARNILGLTFTNKAAQEMATRVRQLCPDARVWMGTFHRFCARLLRQWGAAVGLSGNFSIFDTTEQRQLLRDVLRDLGYDPTHYPPDRIGELLSRAKNDLVDPDTFAQSHADAIGDHLKAAAAAVYPEYQRRLLQLNAVDFDDLLLHVVRLLEENDQLRQELDRRYRYILVDEYQDTNLAQYLIVAAISQREPNLCVTGDPDQSIYGWRGARLDNILRFEADFPGAKVVRLEENFRSTAAILRSAAKLISHNRYRKEKALLTDRHEGPPVELWCFRDEQHEADGVARAIRQMVERGEAEWKDVAIFYRVNSLARDLQRALARHRIPHQLAAGVAFFDRAEVRDLLAYLRVLANPADDVAFLRVVNRPQRGIGRTTQQRLVRWAQSQGLRLWEAARRADQCPELSKRAAGRLRRFAELLQNLSLADAGSVEGLLRAVVDRTGYTQGWEESTNEKDAERLAVVRDLLRMAADYDRWSGADASLEGFLESTSLASDVDTLDETAGKVTLMTLHAAKGLEFPVVFIVALEHNILPHERALNSDDPRDYEEERRLLFVGMTRAMKRLVLTRVVRRPVRGRYFDAIPSPFLGEMEFEVRDFTQEDEGASGSTGSDVSLLAPPSTPSAPTDEQAQGAGASNSSGQERRRKRRRPSPPASSGNRPRLTTAAALLEGRNEEVAVPFGFQVGMRVRHPRFGAGTVVEVSGFARNRQVTVVFDEDQQRATFNATDSPLQPIGLR